MSKEEKPRPIYGSSQGGIPAEAMRLLPPQEAERLMPLSWWSRIPDYIKRTLGLKNIPSGSGFGYIYPPYYSVYNLVYGLIPIADLPKYRIIYRGEPDIKGGIDLIVNLATSKGFTIEYDDDDARELLEETVDRLDLGEIMQIMCRDMLVFGNAYCEVVWDNSDEIDEEVELPQEIISFVSDEFPKLERNMSDLNTTETAYLAIKQFQPTIQAWRTAISKKRVYKKKDGKYYTQAKILTHDSTKIEATKLIKTESKNIIGLKALDPVTMRVRADPFGLIYGFIQWLQWPPAIIDTDSMIHLKNAPTSEAYQTVYGQSQILPLIRNNDLLRLFDQDVANWIHNQAVLPLWIKAGAAPDKPYSTEQMKQLVSDWTGRTAATTVFTKSDVEIAVLKGGGRDLKVDWWQKYLLERRMLALGIPPIFMGVTAGIGRATGEVMLSDFITRVQSLQNHLGSMVVDRMFTPLIIANFGEKLIKEKGYPKVIWKPIVEEDRNKRLLNVDRLAVDGIISVNEAREATGWQPFRRKGHEDYDEQYDEPNLLRVPPQLGKLGMPEKPTKGLQDLQKQGKVPQQIQQKAPTENKNDTDKEEEIEDPYGIKLEEDKILQGQPNLPRQDIGYAKPSGFGYGVPSVYGKAAKIVTDIFQKDLEAILDEVTFEIRAGGVLAKDIKSKYNKKAKELIAKWVALSSLSPAEQSNAASQYVKQFNKLIAERIESG